MRSNKFDFGYLVCALDVDHNSSVLCNSIGYSNLSAIGGDNQTKPRFQRRDKVYQWICIRDIVNGLITCNRTLKQRNLNEIFMKMDLWLESKPKSEITTLTTPITNIKSFKAQARQLVWDLMEMK